VESTQTRKRAETDSNLSIAYFARGFIIDRDQTFFFEVIGSSSTISLTLPSV